MYPLLVALAAAATVQATPDVEVVPKELTCSNWPFYRQTASVAGPFTLFADSTGTEIDGNRASYVTISDTSIAAGWVCIDESYHLSATQKLTV